MSEYWKSTPRYFCKYCNVYVRDTKLERNNHESTGKHQGALKRFLRNLHRSHDQEEREKERTQREIDRLNGIVGGASSESKASDHSSNAGPGSRGPPNRASAPSKLSVEDERKRQLEQLADMGVAIPSELRPDMAIAGEWTVTSTRIIPRDGEGDGQKSIDSVATGMRKREVTEEEKEEEEAMSRLFKKPRKWGHDSKLAPSEDKELDALLRGDLFTGKAEPKIESSLVKDEDKEDTQGIKRKFDVSDSLTPSEESATKIKIKTEPEDEAAPSSAPKTQAEVEPAIVFKKRKPKNIRQK
ncbi:hypothetical protein HOO65_010157 [Ceratocystis lukuohia]|uniref:U1-type domain-containing protein n=1 Tax=Ceratocystis lukuohia TaxID=2019550 RepID=A0ABR4MRB2_9PEZI